MSFRPARATRAPGPSPPPYEEPPLIPVSNPMRPRRAHLRALGFLALMVLAGCGGAKAPGGARVSAKSGMPLVLPEHYAQSIAALGWPGAKRAFQLGDGAQVFAGDAAFEWRIAEEGVKTTPVYFESDGVPVAHWTMTGAENRIDFEAAAAPLDVLGDTSLVVSVRATVTRTAPGTGEFSFEAHVRDRPEGPHAEFWDADPSPGREQGWQDHGAWCNGRLVALVDDAASIPSGAPTRTKPTTTDAGDSPGLVATCHATLARGEPRTWEFSMPAYPIDLDAKKLRSAIKHDDIAARARSAWRGWLSDAVQFETPDTLVNAAWRAALVTLIQCQEKDGNDWLPIGNPFQYRDVWIRDGARVVRALAVAGLSERAKANAWTFRRYQLPPGAFLSQRGQLDATGQALWAFEQVASLPPDPKTAKRYLDIASQALDWIVRERRATRQLDLRYGDLLP